MEIEPNSSKEVVIETATPVMKSLDLRTPASFETVRTYLSSAAMGSLKERVTELVKLQTEMANLEQRIGTTREQMAEYRAPFIDKDNRQATLNWPRQLPIAGEPTNIVALVQQYADWLQQCSIPKLFINAEPGSILIEAQREFCRTWPNQKEVTVKGLHFIQEDSPDEIGRAVAAWVAGLP